MKRFSTALLAALSAALYVHPAAAAAPDPDPWFGPDKALHFGFSVGLASAGYGVSSLFLGRYAPRALAGAGFSLTLGAGKELYDLTGHGDPSWRDFTWDIAGTAVGVGLSLLVDALLAPDHRGDVKTSGTQMAIRF
jgi:putative lipoprotein